MEHDAVFFSGSRETSDHCPPGTPNSHEFGYANARRDSDIAAFCCVKYASGLCVERI
jgi:hypothetical protein